MPRLIKPARIRRHPKLPRQLLQRRCTRRSVWRRGLRHCRCEKHVERVGRKRIVVCVTECAREVRRFRLQVWECAGCVGAGEVDVLGCHVRGIPLVGGVERVYALVEIEYLVGAPARGAVAFREPAARLRDAGPDQGRFGVKRDGNVEERGVGGFGKQRSGAEKSRFDSRGEGGMIKGFCNYTDAKASEFDGVRDALEIGSIGGDVRARRGAEGAVVDIVTACDSFKKDGIVEDCSGYGSKMIVCRFIGTAAGVGNQTEGGFESDQSAMACRDANRTP